MRVIAIVVGAGQGSRFGTIKQYTKIAGKSIIAHTINALSTHHLIELVLPVINKDHLDYFHAITKELDCLDKILSPVYGGDKRHDSCYEGLKAVEHMAPEIVLIHDAARPLVSQKMISELINIERGEAALPVLPIQDTIKLATEDDKLKTVDRSNMFLAQTPQSFCFPSMIQARRKNNKECVDDIEFFELSGLKIKRIVGDPMNFKITFNHDLRLAEALLEHRVMNKVMHL